MKKEIITVVVPVYNTEKYLGECLDSLLCQTYGDLHIICVNDGSNRISSYVTENGGAAAARNFGISRFMEDETSDFIMFVDSDDTVEQDFVEKLYETLLEFNADASTCDWKYYGKTENGDGRRRVYSKDEVLTEYFKDLVYTESPVHRLFRKNTFKTIRFPEGKHFEDTFISYKLIESFTAVSHINYNGYNVRVRNESLTNSRYSDANYDKVEAGLEIYRFYKGTKFERSAYNKYLGILLYFILKTNANRNDVKKNETAVQEVTQLIHEKGFRDAKLKFYPFIIATYLGLIRYIRL